MADYKSYPHSVSRLSAHIVWITKYRLVKKLKGRSAHHLQQEFPALRKRYWGQHFWTVGHGVWSTGNVTHEMVQEYLEHHMDKPNTPTSNWRLET